MQINNYDSASNPVLLSSSSSGHYLAGTADNDAVDATNNTNSTNADFINISIVSNSRLWSSGLPALLAPHIALNIVGSYSAESAGKSSLHIPSPLPSLSTLTLSMPSNPSKHVVLLDANLGQEGLVLWTHRWLDLTPPLQVLVLEMKNDTDIQGIVDCIRAGVRGFTLEGGSALEVAETIKQVSLGLVSCPSAVITRLFGFLATPTIHTTPTSLIVPTTNMSNISNVPDVPNRFNILAAQVAPVPLIEPIEPVYHLILSLTARELEVLRYIAADYSNQDIAAKLIVEVTTVKYHVHQILEKLKVHDRHHAAHLAVQQGLIVGVIAHAGTGADADINVNAVIDPNANGEDDSADSAGTAAN